jgi:hypothetical protein
MTDADRFRREREFKEVFERQLPEFARMCADSVEMVIFHQEAFAADYQESSACWAEPLNTPDWWARTSK